MRLNTILIPFTLAMLIFTVVTVANHIRARQSEKDATPSRDLTAAQPSVPSAERSLLASSKALLVVGVSSKIPTKDDYNLLDKVPWELSRLSRLFRDAGVENSCSLLESGADVIQPLLDVLPDTAGPLGRRSAFSIQLQIGEQLGEGLPSVTRGIIEDYLKAHRLTIQPTFYYDEKGQLVLSPELRAAFVRQDSPKMAVQAEKLIATSIGELRTLGAYWNSARPFNPAACRTLVMGFRYTLDAVPAAAKGSAQREYELLFLHVLPDATPQNPKIAVFATSDARTQFHLLEETDPDSEEQIAAITADVRFADTKLMGMYPESPVVTKVHHRALLSIPVTLVMSQIEGIADEVPVEGFSGVLDTLYATAVGNPDRAGDPQKQPLSQALNPVPEFQELAPVE